MYNLLESVGDKIQDGGFMLLLGMVIVFFGMFIIILFVTLFGKGINKFDNLPKKQAPVAQKVEEKKSNGLSDEEVAAIVAAITCFYGDNKKCDFVVRKIKKI